MERFRQEASAHLDAIMVAEGRGGGRSTLSQNKEFGRNYFVKKFIQRTPTLATPSKICC